ncbi:MAG TPA: glycosyltransferase family 39 protein [Kiritimatiellia bacterium]|nr:glycosyltransferase family 39 protein [Kiritimatiellia bacterium]
MIAVAIAGIAGVVIRAFPLLVVACLLYFPAYKGILLGYIPVSLGLHATIILVRKKDALLHFIGTRSFPVLALWLYGIPALIQLLLVVIFNSAPMFDGLFVYQHAVKLVETGEMDPLTYYPPAQTWWYALWFSVFNSSVLIAQLSQIPLSLLVTWSTWRLARTCMPYNAATAVALLVAWYPSFIGYVLTTPYYHYLYTLLTVLMVWGLLTFRHHLSQYHVFLAGVAAGLGALTKAVQLIAPLQVITWVFVLACATSFRDVIKTWRAGIMVFVAGMLLMLSPWMLRNWFVFQDIVPVCTSGGLVLYSANNPESNGLYSALPDQVIINTPREMLEHSRWCSEQAKAFMVEHRDVFLRLVGIKFIHTWGGEATFTDLMNWHGESRWWIKQGFSFVFMFGWSLLVFAWVYTAWRAVRGRFRLSSYEILAGVIIISNAVVYVVFEGGDRHHLPLVPLIAVLAFSQLIRPNEVDGTSNREVEAR